MQNYAYELLMKEMRVDGRKFEDFRDVKIETGIIAKAEGSARVKLGETELIVGVKLNTGTPFADTPDEGILIVNSEFTPMASPDFESGPPSEDAVELSRVVDRGLRESGCIELGKLCIKPKEKVWCVFIDIHIINHQGNLLDAAALASIAALHNAKLPKLKDDEVIRTEFEGKLPMKYKPINVTVCKFGSKFLLDPNFDEEKTIDAKLSISVRDDDKICALQKQGTEPIDFADLEKMFDIAMKKTKELRELIK